MKCNIDPITDYSGGLTTKLLIKAKETECQAKADTVYDKPATRGEKELFTVKHKNTNNTKTNNEHNFQFKFLVVFMITALSIELIFSFFKIYKQVYYIRIAILGSLLLFLFINNISKINV